MSEMFVRDWIGAQLSGTQAERETLSARAAQLLDDPLVLKVLSVMEASALRDVIYGPMNDPEALAEKMTVFHLTKDLRMRLNALVDEWRIDARKP